MNLALKYRPKTFLDVVGQKATSVILSAKIAKGTLSQVLVFTGPSGVGKTSMARIIAAELNPEGAQDVHAGTHPAVLEIDGASNGSVDAIRQLKKDLNYGIPGHRVVIIDEVHAISDVAFAALLNLLEFPPPNVTIILITTEAHKIPKTIRTRADRYPFKKASFEDIKARLAFVISQEGIQIDTELVNLLANRADGSYREALMLLEQVSDGEITTLEEYNALRGEADFGPSLLRSAMGGPPAAISKLEDILRYTNTEEVSDRTIETLKDVMLMKGGISLNYSGIALESRLELTSKLGTDQILKVMKIIWDLQTKLNAGDPVRGLELVFSLIGEVLQSVDIKSSIAPATRPTSRMSFEDMQRLQK
jgi:DNA polymerase III subunit gamma/tau